MAEISFDDFTKVDIRLGRIVDAAPYPEARKPAIKLWIDFGAELGVKKVQRKSPSIMRLISCLGSRYWRWSIFHHVRLGALCPKFWCWGSLAMMAVLCWWAQIARCRLARGCIENFY